MSQIYRNNRGVSRLVVIMTIAVVLLALPIAWGIWTSVQAETERKECNIAIGSAQRKLDDEFLLNSDMTPEEAEDAATSEIRSLDGTCPSGGHYVIVKKKDTGGYRIYCEIHGKE